MLVVRLEFSHPEIGSSRIALVFADHVVFLGISNFGIKTCSFIIIIIIIIIVTQICIAYIGRVVQWPNQRRIRVMVDNVIGRLAGNKMFLI